jgi:hypothetical protein
LGARIRTLSLDATADDPVTWAWARWCPEEWSPVMVPRLSTFVPGAGVMSKTELETDPKEMSVTLSSSTGELDPRA